MNTAENKPEETTPAPVPGESLASSAPAPAPAPTAAAAPAPKPVEIVKGIVPTTKGNVAGGWNRFAGYKPGQSKDKKNDRRDDRRGRR